MNNFKNSYELANKLAMPGSVYCLFKNKVPIDRDGECGIQGFIPEPSDVLFELGELDEKLLKEKKATGFGIHLNTFTKTDSGLQVCCLDLDTKRSTLPNGEPNELAKKIWEWCKASGHLYEVSSSLRGCHLFVAVTPEDAQSLARKIDLGDGQELEIFSMGNARNVLLNGEDMSGEFIDQPFDIHGALKTLGLNPERAPEALRESKPKLPKAELEQTIRNAREALTFINPDCSYEDWIRIGQALHGDLGTAGFDLWLAWSERGSSFPGVDEITYKFNSFHDEGSSSGRVGIATLFMMAKDAGYKPAKKSKAKANPKPTGEIVDSDGVIHAPKKELSTALSPSSLVTFGKKDSANDDKIQECFLVNPDDVESVEYNNKGKIIAAAHTIYDFIDQMPIFYDVFTDGLMLKDAEGNLIRFRDSFYADIRVAMERAGFAKVSDADIKSITRSVAQSKRHTFDMAIEWAAQLKWDGVKRCHRLFADYFGAADNEISEYFSMYLATSMAARLLKSDTEVEMVVVLVGDQGVGKTRSVRALSPSPEFFAEIDLSSRDAELSRQLRGKLIVELAELQGLRSKDSEHIKKWISAQIDEYRPLYQEFLVKNKRRCIFIGTTNEIGFLSDHTGNRRWLPLDIVSKGNPEAITRDREQIWAEAITIFNEHGLLWKDSEDMGKELHSDFFSVNEVILEAVKNWIEKDHVVTYGHYIDKDRLVLSEIAQALYPDKAIDVRLQKEIGNVLRKLGYERKEINAPKGSDGKRKKKKVWLSKGARDEAEK